jgi:hypothetical protein
MPIDCEANAKLARKQECLLIFEELPAFTSYSLDAKGKHLITKKECTCTDKNRWWAQYKEYLEKGDTIIKRKGELIFSIHKKDTVLTFDWECEGKVYK